MSWLTCRNGRTAAIGMRTRRAADISVFTTKTAGFIAHKARGLSFVYFEHWW
jgi:hypothetical protein